MIWWSAPDASTHTPNLAVRTRPESSSTPSPWPLALACLDDTAAVWLSDFQPNQTSSLCRCCCCCGCGCSRCPIIFISGFWDGSCLLLLETNIPSGCADDNCCKYRLALRALKARLRSRMLSLTSLIWSRRCCCCCCCCCCSCCCGLLSSREITIISSSRLGSFLATISPTVSLLSLLLSLFRAASQSSVFILAFCEASDGSKWAKHLIIISQINLSDLVSVKNIKTKYIITQTNLPEDFPTNLESRTRRSGPRSVSAYMDSKFRACQRRAARSDGRRSRCWPSGGPFEGSTLRTSWRTGPHSGESSSTVWRLWLDRQR